MKLSVVTSLYKSAPHIQEFHRRVCEAAKGVATELEIILVNDGSPDDSLQRAIALHRHDPRVTIIDLSRNFGHHNALMTGLRAASGNYVLVIDSDLEEPPEVLGRFFETMVRDGCDVVYGYQTARQRGSLDRLTSEIFYRLFNAISPTQIPPNLLTVRLMTRRYLDSFLMHGEREISLAGLWAITGYTQVGLPVEKIRTNASTYDLKARTAIGITSLIGFSNQPLILGVLVGAAISVLAALMIVYLIINWMTTNSLSGWTSVIASIWLMGGLIIFFVGLVGIYVSKIFTEVKQRPHSIIRQIYSARDESRAKRDDG
jgi:putative glycosyltransferase